MPRTKISKSKRNRDAAKEEREEVKNERLREFDYLCEQIEQANVAFYNSIIDDLVSKTESFKLKMLEKILSMPFRNLINLDESIFNEFNKSETRNASKFINVSSVGPLISTVSTLSVSSQKSKDDEGYLTEDSSRSSNKVKIPAFPTHTGRTPGPLSSAKAKAQVRRSRSASGLINNIPKTTMSEHKSRSKLRTPLIQQKPSLRQKAISADRAPYTPKLNDSNSPVLYRWPKPGEKIVSEFGSPIVPSMTIPIANINIPTKNGIFSLRPKRVNPAEIGQKIAEGICPETLSQIRQLQTNLELIMKIAETEC